MPCSPKTQAHIRGILHIGAFHPGMETFRGILICATNFMSALDCAALRRFNIKLEFDYLKPEGIMAFYMRFLNGLTCRALSRKESAELAAMTQLTPGDFKVVYQKYVFPGKRRAGHRVLIDALRQEIGAGHGKQRTKMGF